LTVLQSDKSDKMETITNGPKTVLVVEDFEDVRDAMKILVELQGYRVLTASDGREAVEKARQYHPDLILMDIAMPLVDGIEATRQIKSDSSVSEIPIVAVTSFSRQYHDEALAAGCDRVLEKPSVMGDIAVLRSILP
jgi:Response regulators consisting of a CheY-like receiver domain and a winged-helix DNA-binding domain